MFEKRTKFSTLCPYCLSSQTVKAGRKLKFRSIYFEDDNPNYVRKYYNVPMWKCSVCKKIFVVDMAEHSSLKMENFEGTGHNYGLITREEWKNG